MLYLLPLSLPFLYPPLSNLERKLSRNQSRTLTLTLVLRLFPKVLVSSLFLFFPRFLRILFRLGRGGVAGGDECPNGALSSPPSSYKLPGWCSSPQVALRRARMWSIREGRLPLKDSFTNGGTQGKTLVPKSSIGFSLAYFCRKGDAGGAEAGCGRA